MPSLMEWPSRITRNHNISWPGVSNDLLPTVLDVLGVTSAHPSWVVDGVSLLPVVAAAEAGVAIPKREKGIGHATMLPGDGWDRQNGLLCVCVCVCVSEHTYAPEPVTSGSARGHHLRPDPCIHDLGNKVHQNYQPPFTIPFVGRCAGCPSFDSSYILRSKGTVGPAPPDACQEPTCSRPDKGDSPIQQQLAWTDNNFKLWVHLEHDGRGAGTGWRCNSVKHGIGSRENCSYVYRLYDIVQDPYETTELSGTHPQVLKAMTADLLEWYGSVLASSSATENNCRQHGWRPP